VGFSMSSISLSIFLKWQAGAQMGSEA